MPWTPPRGQRCKNCLSCEPYQENSGLCHFYPPADSIPMPSVDLMDDWCGAWRPSRDTRCGACEHHGHNECPRVVFASNGLMLASSNDTFACARFEEKAT